VGTATEVWRHKFAHLATPELIEICENYRVLQKLFAEYNRHLSVIQGRLGEATRIGKCKDDQLSLIEYWGRVVATLKTISPPVEQ
jgi:hypothetical protein